jgi:hypothetical protein
MKKRRILYFAGIIIFSLIVFPFLSIELPIYKIKINSFEDLTRNSYDDITEKTLLNSGYQISNNPNDAIILFKADTFKIRRTKIPVKIFFSFVNYANHTGYYDESTFLMSRNHPYFCLPYSVGYSFSSKFENQIIKYLDEQWGTKFNYGYIDIPNAPDTTFGKDWIYTDKKDTLFIIYARYSGSTESIIWRNIKRSKFRSLKKLYVELIYNKMPLILQPRWFKKINSMTSTSS